MRAPPRPVLYAIAHAAGTIAIVAGAMALAAVLPTLIGPAAVLAIVTGFGVAAWAGAALVIPRVLPAANDNAPMPVPGPSRVPLDDRPAGRLILPM